MGSGGVKNQTNKTQQATWSLENLSPKTKSQTATNMKNAWKLFK